MRLLLLLALAVAFALPAIAQKEDWLPITPDDLQIKQVPGDPGASVIQDQELKDFMSKIQAGDEQQVVLRVEATSNAQKTN